MVHIKVQTEDFDVGAEIAAMTAGRTDIGGIGCFVGIVRADARGERSKVIGMTLEHYPGMTERAIRNIADQAAEKWPLLGCTVIHRVGPLRPGENIVAGARRFVPSAGSARCHGVPDRLVEDQGAVLEAGGFCRRRRRLGRCA